jgi:hypothetical protein
MEINDFSKILTLTCKLHVKGNFPENVKCSHCHYHILPDDGFPYTITNGLLTKVLESICQKSGALFCDNSCEFDAAPAANSMTLRSAVDEDDPNHETSHKIIKQVQ